MYKHGTGVLKSLERAVALYRQSSDMGDTAGMVELGHCYRQVCVRACVCVHACGISPRYRLLCPRCLVGAVFSSLLLLMCVVKCVFFVFFSRLSEPLPLSFFPCVYMVAVFISCHRVDIVAVVCFSLWIGCVYVLSPRHTFVGRLLVQGLGIEKDLAQAFATYQQAGEMGFGFSFAWFCFFFSNVCMAIPRSFVKDWGLIRFKAVALSTSAFLCLPLSFFLSFFLSLSLCFSLSLCLSLSLSLSLSLARASSAHETPHKNIV